METNRVRQFCVVAETLNLRKAAEILGISHGGLFKSLKVLEEELGYSLFLKEGRSLQITDKGKSLYPKSVRFLESFNEFIQTNDTQENQLRIGTYEVFSTYFFTSSIAREFTKRNIFLRELVPGQIEQATLNNEIDIGITYEPVPLNGLNLQAISKCEMSLFSKSNFLIDKPISKIPFAAPTTPITSPATGLRTLDGWPDDKYPRNIVYQVDMMETALQLCSEGLAVGFFPDFIVKMYNSTRKTSMQLIRVPSPKGFKKMTRVISVITRESYGKPLELKKICKCLRNYCF